jgi:hypothetical protein
MFTGMLQPSHLILILIVGGVDDAGQHRAPATLVEDEKPRPQ